MTRLTRSLTAFVLLFPGLVAQASDHLDGPATTADAISDLSDLFAFPTPDQPGSLSIVLDMYPIIRRGGHFSEKVDYTLTVRRAEVRAGGSPGFDTGEAVAIRCSFDAPHDGSPHHATCAIDGGASVTVQVDQIVDRPQGAALRVFAGTRCEPFFLNPDFAKAITVEGEPGRPRGKNAMEGLNTLSVALELDLRAVFPDDPPELVAVAAEASTRDTPGAAERRLDRLGRPEITNIALAARGDQPDLREDYNLDPTFAVPADHAATYRQRIAENLAFYDAIDGATDWQDDARVAMAGVLAEDFLVVDLTRPCAADSFLEIERSLLSGESHRTCGGARPGDDVLDVMYGVSVGGLGGLPMRDGVDRSKCEPGDAFPYLAPPTKSLSGRIKAGLFNKTQRSRR